MRLESLRLQNFRGFEDAILPLDRPLTVLFGENGSGKSSVLMALALCISAVLDPILKNRRSAYWSPTDDDIRRTERQSTMALTFRHDNQSLRGTFIQQRLAPSMMGQFQAISQIILKGTPFLCIYHSANRTVDRVHDILEKEAAKEPRQIDSQWGLADSLNAGGLGFRTFFLWFKEREDAENRRKVQEKNFSAVDPHLSAVRAAIEGLFPTYTNPRIQHDPLRLEITKGDQPLSMDQLSDGEKQVLVMTADIARRLSMVYPNETNPLEQEAVILVDEVELHLHPLWQRKILPAWRRIFPGCQFIVTTHSPQVISEVPNDAVFLVKDFQFVRPGAPTEGRDSNSILEETMGTPERPPEIKAELANIASLIDEEKYGQARDSLDKLAQRLTEQDNEVVRLRTMLHFMEGAHATDSQG
jgi:predicted ATP-binding protein involved in virulence